MFAGHRNSLERVSRGVARVAKAGVSATFLALLLATAGEAAAQRSGSSWTLEKLVSAAVDQNPGLAASRAAATGIAEEIAAAELALAILAAAEAAALDAAANKNPDNKNVDTTDFDVIARVRALLGL